MKKFSFTKIFILFICVPLLIQSQDRKNRFTFWGNYTTSAKIYLSPFSSDPFIRNSFFSVGGFYHYSFEYGYFVLDDILVSINIEYARASSSGKNLTVLQQLLTSTIEVEDGFEVYPIELSIYYMLPFSLEKFKFFMGGGVGVYFGNHIRKFGDASVSNLERKFAYGIQVAALMEYQINNFLSALVGMKFRDPQFTVKNKYDKKEVSYQNKIILVAQDSFDSKINLDGLNFMLGLSYRF